MCCSVMVRIRIPVLGPDLCPVNFFTGHVGSWTRVQEWTRVQILPCPVKKFTGHKPYPVDLYVYIIDAYVRSRFIRLPLSLSHHFSFSFININ